jgi:hypothetical protein
MNYFNQMGANAWITHPLIMYPLLVWMIVWKGLALWYAARRDQKVWYVILLIVNTLGILKIIYIFAVAKRPKTPAPLQPPVAKV